MAWPTKTDFVDGDVLNASQMNNIGTNLNLYNPTSATNGQVPIANGAGSVAFGTIVAAAFTQISTGSFSGTTYNISSIPNTYKHLYLRIENWKVTASSARLYAYPNTNNTTTSATWMNAYHQGASSGVSYSTLFDSQFTINNAQQLTVSMWLWDYASTTNTEKVASYIMSTPNTSSAFPAQAATLFGAGRSTISGAINRVSFENSASQTMTGTWTLFGVN